MKLRVLGSSSRGNCYLLQSETTGEVLVIEAGIRMQTVKKALDFRLSDIVGCCVTHEHGDHAKHAREFADTLIPMVMSKGTAEAVGITDFWCPTPKCPLRLGGFRILSFPVRHDAADPRGFLIQHKECGTVLFATDTYYLPNTFPGLNNILIECNYRLDILDRNIAEGRVSAAVRNRIVKSHMSYNTCCETLLANDLSRVNNIVLLHLSADNSHAEEFRAGIAALTEKQVSVAKAEMEIDFNTTPY